MLVSTECYFCFGKSSNYQNHSSGSHHLVKKFTPRISSTPYRCLENPVYCPWHKTKISLKVTNNSSNVSNNIHKYNNSVESCCKYTGNHLLHHKIGWLWTFRVTWTHWLKYMFVFYGNFRFFWGIQITLFCHRSRIHGNTQCINFCLMLFKKWYE